MEIRTKEYTITASGDEVNSLYACVCTELALIYITAGGSITPPIMAAGVSALVVEQQGVSTKLRILKALGVIIWGAAVHDAGGKIWEDVKNCVYNIYCDEKERKNAKSATLPTKKRT